MQESKANEDNQQATLFDKGLLSGLFLGEGSVGFANCNNKELANVRVTPRIRIANTDPKLIEAMDRILSELFIPHHIEQRRKLDGYKQAWTVNVQGWKRVLLFIKCFENLTVGDKHEQLKMLAELIPLRLKRKVQEPYSLDEVNLIERIKELNKQRVLRD